MKVCVPASLTTFSPATVHSLAEEVVQSVVGAITSALRIKVLLAVAFAVPETVQPVPGSAPSAPTASIKLNTVPLPPFHAKPIASSPLKFIGPVFAANITFGKANRFASAQASFNITTVSPSFSIPDKLSVYSVQVPPLLMPQIS